MKVAFVSVFPPNTNGIGDYTLDLARAISALGAGVVVLADRAGEQEMDVAVDRCWTPHGDWVPDVLAAAERARPDVVHLQHGGYMGRDGRVPALLEGLRARGIRTAITLHGVYPQRRRSLLRPSKWSPLRFHRALGAASDRIVIHQKAGALDPLVDHGVDAARVAIIPHGTPAVPAIDPRAARERLGLPLDRPLALFLGFIEYSKGVDTVVRGFGDVAAAVPGALFVIAGRIEQHDLQDRLYRYSLERRVRAGGSAGWIEFRPGYLPADDVPAYLAAADVVVFPYRQKHGSASGILHRTFAAGRAVVCSRGPKFADAADALGADADLALPPEDDVPAWTDSLARVLGDRDLRARIAGVTADLGRKSAWPVVAGQHLALYDELTSARPA
ncbi:MAG TPA: glycosyltransferase [Kofleriaceae bacterium]|jgi:glycosyltransferase involved in cell wall biosynthesis